MARAEVEFLSEGTTVRGWYYAPEGAGPNPTILEDRAVRYRDPDARLMIPLNYDIIPFARRVIDPPTLMIVAEGDDLTPWDLEIGSYNKLPTAKKRRHVLPHTTHMTLYSDRSKLEVAAREASSWFADTLLEAGHAAA